MSKGGKSQTVTNKLDPETQRMQQEIFDRARQVADQPYQGYQGQQVAGVNPYTNAAVGGYQQAQNLGMGGMQALAGNPEAISKLMNPYQQQVIGALGGEYDRMRNQAALGSNDAATQAGAFGGDRHALMVGERQGALDRQQMGDVAGLLQSGYENAMGRAGSLANFGMGAADRMFSAGDYNRNVAQQGLDAKQRQFLEQRDWGMRGLDAMRGAMSGMPHGSSTSQPMTRNLGAGMLGGAATGAQIGTLVPGLGTAVGAGIGGILGML